MLRGQAAPGATDAGPAGGPWLDDTAQPPGRPLPPRPGPGCSNRPDCHCGGGGCPPQHIQHCQVGGEVWDVNGRRGEGSCALPLPARKQPYPLFCPDEVGVGVDSASEGGQGRDEERRGRQLLIY